LTKLGLVAQSWVNLRTRTTVSLARFHSFSDQGLLVPMLSAGFNYQLPAIGIPCEMSSAWVVERAPDVERW